MEAEQLQLKIKKQETLINELKFRQQIIKQENIDLKNQILSLKKENQHLSDQTLNSSPLKNKVSPSKNFFRFDEEIQYENYLKSLKRNSSCPRNQKKKRSYFWNEFQNSNTFFQNDKDNQDVNENDNKNQLINQLQNQIIQVCSQKQEKSNNSNEQEQVEFYSDKIYQKSQQNGLNNYDNFRKVKDFQIKVVSSQEQPQNESQQSELNEPSSSNLSISQIYYQKTQMCNQNDQTIIVEQEESNHQELRKSVIRKKITDNDKDIQWPQINKQEDEIVEDNNKQNQVLSNKIQQSSSQDEDNTSNKSPPFKKSHSNYVVKSSPIQDINEQKRRQHQSVFINKLEQIECDPVIQERNSILTNYIYSEMYQPLYRMSKMISRKQSQENNNNGQNVNNLNQVDEIQFQEMSDSKYKNVGRKQKKAQTMALNSLNERSSIQFIQKYSNKKINNKLGQSNVQRLDTIDDENDILEDQDKNKSNLIEETQDNEKKEKLGDIENKEVPVNKYDGIGSKLFEHFLVIGPDSKQVEENYIGNKEDQEVIHSQILHKFPENLTESEEVKLQGFLSFFFPMGLEVKKIYKGRKEKANEIAFAPVDTFFSKDCFILNLMGDQNMQDDQIPDSLKRINNQKKQFLICFKSMDYVFPRKSNGKDKNTPLLLVPKIYCFVTYYPLVDFFIKIMSVIQSNQKLMRIKKLMENDGNTNEKLKIMKYDLKFSIKTIKNDTILSQSLQNLYQQTIVPFGTLKWEYTRDVAYQIPVEEKIQWDKLQYTQSQAGGGLTFSNIPYSDFLFILLAIIYEKHVLFFSNSQALLSSTLMCFHKIMKPFIYPHVLMYIVPETLIESLEVPPPCLLGCNFSLDYLEQEHSYLQLLEDEYIYIDLDQGIIKCHHTIQEQIMCSIPNFFQEGSRFEKIYKALNPNKSWKLQKKSKKWFDQLLFNPNEIQKEKIFNIIKEVENIFETNIVQYYPQEIFIDEDDSLDHEKIKQYISSKNQKDSEFLYKLLESQLFMYNLDFYYGFQKLIQ